MGHDDTTSQADGVRCDGSSSVPAIVAAAVCTVSLTRPPTDRDRLRPAHLV
jgi:hypothetical protein